MMNIVLDTNCLLMSLSRRSQYYPIWRDFVDGKYTLCISNDILAEYEEILTQKVGPQIASNIIQAWGERVPESLGALISRCKCTGMSIRDLLKANGRNPTSARGDAEAKIKLLDRVWDMYSMECAQNDLADYEDMVIQSTGIISRGGFP